MLIVFVIPKSSCIFVLFAMNCTIVWTIAPDVFEELSVILYFVIQI